MRARFRVASIALAAACAGLGLSAPTTAAQSKTYEEFSAIFSNISNVGAVGAAPVTIRITRWTPVDEHEKLMAILADKGTEALVRALQSAKSVGSIGTPQTLPYDLRYARQEPFEGKGRKIILMSDRPMEAWERFSSAVSRDYPITWIEMKLDADGRGSGSISLAARLRLLGDFLGIEDYANQPARLNEIKKVK